MSDHKDIYNKIVGTMFNSMRMTKTPCNNMCKLVNDVCISCNRTGAEIFRQGISKMNETDFEGR